jgi:hypothetical protein
MLVADVCMTRAKSVFRLFPIHVEQLANIFRVETAQDDGGFYPPSLMARELRPNMDGVRDTCGD